jgi:pyruvate dehydrogenase kinase 2/3/4
VYEYNAKFTKLISNIKRRHDPTVTTVAQGILDWKRSRNVSTIGMDVQRWLDRFYMSRIGIRFLIGQSTFYYIIAAALLELNFSPIDIALNTLQSHEDYVGIICTNTVCLERFLSCFCFLTMSMLLQISIERA